MPISNLQYDDYRYENGRIVYDMPLEFIQWIKAMSNHIAMIDSWDWRECKIQRHEYTRYVISRPRTSGEEPADPNDELLYHIMSEIERTVGKSYVILKAEPKPDMDKYRYLLHVIEAFERCEAIAPEEDSVSLWDKESSFWDFQLKRAVVRASEGSITIETMKHFSLDDFREFAYEALARPYLYGEYDDQD